MLAMLYLSFEAVIPLWHVLRQPEITQNRLRQLRKIHQVPMGSLNNNDILHVSNSQIETCPQSQHQTMVARLLKELLEIASQQNKLNKAKKVGFAGSTYCILYADIFEITNGNYTFRHSS